MSEVELHIAGARLDSHEVARPDHDAGLRSSPMLDQIVIVGAGNASASLLPRARLLAPILILDTDQGALAALRDDVTDGATPAWKEASNPVTTRLADGTSRFVLEEARGKDGLSVALVAATGDDRKNVEVCRIGHELGFRPVVGIVVDPASSSDYERTGAHAVVRAALVGQAVEHSLRHDGLLIATSVGQGKGEIIELVVLPGSPAIDMPLGELQTDDWRVAAIYRRGKLVIPTGKTVVAADDRLLIVGDPALLPSVAEQLRIGAPMFPLHDGKRVVVYLPSGRDRAIEMEAEVLTIKTRATSLVRVYPGAEPATTPVEDDHDGPSALAPHQRSKTFEDVPLEGALVPEQIEQIRRLRPGVVVARGEARSLWSRLLGRGGAPMALCNALSAPVLFPRGAPHYARVVHALIQGIADMTLADIAIDLARMLEVPLVVARVSLPEYLGTPDPHTDRVVAGIERRTRLYGLSAATLLLEGNPVTELLNLAKPSDLFVIGRKRTTRDSFTSPDIALRVAAAAVGSILVKTLEEP